MEINKENLLDIYRIMIRIRKFEEKALELYRQSLMGGSVHLYIGEEAVAATIGKLLRKDDYISSTHRGHGHIIGKGARTDLAMAELLGKATGFCKGRGGSMHIADFDNGILGANGIVGGGIPAAVGAGLSAKMQGRDSVSLAYFGDGAANEGSFHESINLAAVWKLPVIFVCENNLYGMTVPISESTVESDIYLRGSGYGVPSEKVDGNDVFAVFKAATRAIERARSGEGPTLLEFKTYRWRGHWEGDPMDYRTEEELNEWMMKCPIKQFEDRLMQDFGVKREELDYITDEVADEIEKAGDFAINSPYPDPATLLDDLFAENKAQ